MTYGFHVGTSKTKTHQHDYSNPFCDTFYPYMHGNCPRQNVTVYENKGGDVGMDEQFLFSLLMKVIITSGGTSEIGEPKYFNVWITSEVMTHRLGNVGVPSVLLLLIYITVFIMVFRSEVVAVALLPITLWRLVRCRLLCRRRTDAFDLIMDTFDKLDHDKSDSLDATDLHFKVQLDPTTRRGYAAI